MERQKIIEKAINIENIISLLITFHYFPDKEKGINSNFLQDVLYDPYATVAFKINLLQKCFPGFGCQSAFKNDPPSASKNDPPQALVFSY
jgi:hypothetical protein